MNACLLKKENVPELVLITAAVRVVECTVPQIKPYLDWMMQLSMRSWETRQGFHIRHIRTMCV